MAKAEPFIETFRGKSFVVYDDGTIWSKTLKTAFGGRGAGINNIQHHYRIGTDINEIARELGIDNVSDYYSNEKITERENQAKKRENEVHDFWRSRIADPTPTRKWQSDYIWGALTNTGMARPGPGQPYPLTITISKLLDCRGIGGNDIQHTFEITYNFKSKSASGKSGYYEISDASRKAITNKVEEIIDKCTKQDTEGFKRMLSEETK